MEAGRMTDHAMRSHLQRILNAVDDNRSAVSDLTTTVKVMEVDVGYLKKTVEKSEAEMRAKSMVRNGRWFSAIIAVFSAVLGIVAAGVTALMTGGGNAGQ